jgi:protein-tyrosine phosphatase
VISLMEPQERNHSGQAFVEYTKGIAHLAEKRGQKVACFRYPVVDGSVPSPETMKAILDRLDETIKTGGSAYVHCWGGRGRTGTAVCCWMIRNGIVAPEQAVDHLQTLIRHNAQAFYPTPEFQIQRDFVFRWTRGQ